LHGNFYNLFKARTGSGSVAAAQAPVHWKCAEIPAPRRSVPRIAQFHNFWPRIDEKKAIIRMGSPLACSIMVRIE
jgi:hypothetical protein